MPYWREALKDAWFFLPRGMDKVVVAVEVVAAAVVVVVVRGMGMVLGRVQVVGVEEAVARDMGMVRDMDKGMGMDLGMEQELVPDLVELGLEAQVLVLVEVVLTLALGLLFEEMQW